jgi:crotonobetainyl-CoA:carnitine CoA-transferase CaiB-like acyl-CoA transferase
MSTDNTLLKGVTVIDLTRVLRGPFCTMMLGDLGADVIKIEVPGRGDDTRAWGLPFTDSGESAYFLSANRNKRSLTLNLKSRDRLNILEQLTSKRNARVGNFRLGILERRRGLRYAPGNPPVDDLPHAHRLWLRWPQEQPDGLQIHGPSQGRVHECARPSRPHASPPGNVHFKSAPCQEVKANDRHFAFATGNSGRWQAFCKVIGHLERATAERYATNEAGDRSELNSARCWEPSSQNGKLRRRWHCAKR